jgi:hypothetical protein
MKQHLILFTTKKPLVKAFPGKICKKIEKIHNEYYLNSKAYNKTAQGWL